MRSKATANGKGMGSLVAVIKVVWSRPAVTEDGRATEVTRFHKEGQIGVGQVRSPDDAAGIGISVASQTVIKDYRPTALWEMLAEVGKAVHVGVDKVIVH